MLTFYNYFFIIFAVLSAKNLKNFEKPEVTVDHTKTLIGEFIHDVMLIFKFISKLG